LFFIIWVLEFQIDLQGG